MRGGRGVLRRREQPAHRASGGWHGRLRELATAPNAVTLLGLVLTLHGSRRLDSVAGVLQVACGRALDLLDGRLARRLGQVSATGAALDAGTDKLGVLAIATGAWRQGVVARPVVVGILAQNAVSVLATAMAHVRDPGANPAPSVEGKWSMATSNLALAACSLGGLGDRRHPANRLLSVLGHVCAAAGLVRYGLPATRQYLRRAATGRG